MKIYVCVKHVPDSAATITVIEDCRIDENITFLLNPYDENAVEEAARIRERHPGSEVIAVTVGKQDAVKTLQSALAMGAERAILVRDSSCPDSLVTARLLKAAICRDGEPDLVLTGRVAIDSVGYQTMFRLGAALDMPVVNSVTSLAIEDRRVVAECEAAGGGRLVLETVLPCVVGAAKGLNTPRYPTFPDIVKARKKRIDTIAVEDLAVDTPAGRVELLDLQPAVQQRRGEILSGPCEEAVETLVQRLREVERVI
jgi:electron transfer flavoprotein beta subunit